MSQAVSRDGTPWEPKYLEEIDVQACIACGRCAKVCGHGVLAMRHVTEEGEIVDEDDEDAERMAMTIEDKGKCVGCSACSRVCMSKAQKHVAASAAA